MMIPTYHGYDTPALMHAHHTAHHPVYAGNNNSVAEAEVAGKGEDNPSWLQEDLEVTQQEHPQQELEFYRQRPTCGAARFERRLPPWPLIGEPPARLLPLPRRRCDRQLRRRQLRLRRHHRALVRARRCCRGGAARAARGVPVPGIPRPCAAQTIDSHGREAAGPPWAPTSPRRGGAPRPSGGKL